MADGMPVRQLLNLTAVAEQTVYLNCKTSPRMESEKLEWRRDNQLLPANHRQYVFPNGTLAIQAVDARLDSGFYTCRTVDGGSVHQQLDYHLLVIIPPRIDPLVIPTDLSPLARLRVSCLVSRGDPPILIQWFKDGQSLTPAKAAEQDIVIQAIDEYASFLAIASLNVRHAGNYTCLASNSAAQDAKTARLTVNVPAYWVQEPVDAFALHKSDLRMTCQANGNPKPVIEWKRATATAAGSLRNYVPVGGSGRGAVLENGTLVMRNVQRSDEGSYLCQATNGIGPAISKVTQLTVKSAAYFTVDKETFTTPLGGAAALDCRAYGDLPITATWFYKDRPLKEGAYDRLAFQTQNLADGFRSSLKISRSQRGDSGNYACKVSNEFGTATKQLTFLVQEAPEEPKNVAVAATNSRMANVGWTAGYDGSSAVINFIVEWKLVKAGESKWSVEHTPGNSSSYTLKNLRPATRYDIRVRAENLLGQSGPSAVVQILTDEEAPSEVPRDVVVTAASSTTINLTWKPPPPEAHNGLLQGYIVGYRVENSTEGFAYKTVKSDRTGGRKEEAIVFNDLRKYTPYAIVLQAYNAMGSGPKLDLTSVWTKEDVPVEAPGSITATAESSQRISLAWEPLRRESINGILLGYKILYKPLTDWTSQPDIKIVQDTICVLDGLRKFTNYTLQVLAFTKVGDGVVSSTVYSHTLPDVPSHPADIKTLVTSPTSILVTWSEPEEKNGFIKQYNVYLRAPNGKKDKKRVVYPDSGSLNKYEFHDLNTNVQYEFWVTAETEVGEGAASFRMKQAPEATGPARIATFPMTIKAHIGGSAVLPCLTVGFPSPALDWIRGGRIIRNNGINDVLESGSLSVKNIQTSDAGLYTCRVKNIYGDDTVEFTLQVQRPPVPPNVSVSAATAESLVVDWQMLYDGGATVKGFTLYYRPTLGSWKSVRFPASLHSYTLKHLMCGQNYQIYMTAYNDVGPSDSSDTVDAKTIGQTPISSNDKSLLVANVSSVLVFLSTWENGGCPIRSFAMKYQAFAEGNVWKSVGELIPGDAESITISDLAPETLYRLKLTAVNEAGTTEHEYSFGTLTETGEVMMPEVVLQKEKSVLPFHEDPSKMIATGGGICGLLLMAVIIAIFVVKRRNRKYSSSGVNIRRDITPLCKLQLTPKHSQSPWQSVAQFSADPKNHTVIPLSSPARVWMPPARNNNESFYGTPKQLNTAIRPTNQHDIQIASLQFEEDEHYQTPSSNRIIKRDESTPDSGFSGSNVKHSHGDSFRRDSMAPTRFSTGSTTSESDNIHKLNVSAHKNRPKPAQRKRPLTNRSKQMAMGTASLLRARPAPATSSSPSSAEDIPFTDYCTSRVPPRRQHQPASVNTIQFPPPPPTHLDDYEDYREPSQYRQQRRAHEVINLQHRYSVNVRGGVEDDDFAGGQEDMVDDDPLQPTTTV
ncbi:Down syndrome cell adhesion molecule-like protein Dscam2 [Hypsibius exemplaris]|uniref:Down syndrome cell adhesion molecule-like protein Dscam2 n=1 Tax=Hypsibius exemplaris TaxID=2072580 RepID=A0A1W0WDX7_HYPEX|nr:Down syndrome cell adhesion molecule-like protein Dscam2 [Hypsibius exemplaris]